MLSRPTATGPCVTAACQEGAQIADARAREPGERIARAARVRGRVSESAPAIAQRVEHGVNHSRRDGSRMICERAVAIRYRPPAPLLVSDTRIGTERFGV